VGGIVVRLRFQCKLLFSRYEFIASLAFMCLIAAGIFVANCVIAYGSDRYDLLSADQLFIGRDTLYSTIIRLLVPLVAAIPFADSYFSEKQSNTIPTLLVRAKTARHYYFSKIVVVFLASIAVFLIPFLLNMGLNRLVFPGNSMRDVLGWQTSETWYHDASLAHQILFPDLFVLHPYLYNLLFTGMLSLFSGLIGVFTFAASFFVKKNRVFLVALFFIINNVLELLSAFTENFGIVIAPFKYLFAWDTTPGKSMGTFAVILLVMLGSVLGMARFGIKKLEDVL
jgi:hypothetical protein